ncbi:hypothetical protein ACLB2K_043655 [Fragaria x ananassa]
MSDQCSICLESLNSEKEVSETACKHTYHSSCIESSLRYSDSCPLCRRKATPTTLLQLQDDSEYPLFFLNLLSLLIIVLSIHMLLSGDTHIFER